MWGYAVQELLMGCPAWWLQSSAAIWHEGAGELGQLVPFSTGVLRTSPALAVGSQREMLAQQPLPASPWHGFGISHLYGSPFPVPEPQPGLVEADQSVSLCRSK